MKLELKENQGACRRIPVANEQAVRRELDRMLEKGVIEKVTTPTRFIGNITVVPKSNGKIRLCLDPKHLNEA